jgi:hypothetical protein
VPKIKNGRKKKRKTRESRKGEVKKAPLLMLEERPSQKPI